MSAVWKFALEVGDEQAVEMPAGARLLAVQVQGGVPCLWAVVDPGSPPEQRLILTRGTGHELGFDDAEAEYVGTYQSLAGMFVAHVFDAGPVVTTE